MPRKQLILPKFVRVKGDACNISNCNIFAAVSLSNTIKSCHTKFRDNSQINIIAF